MRVIKSLRYKIISHTRILDATVDIYNEDLTFLIEVIEREKLELTTLFTKDVMRIVEKLVHATKSNPSPAYKEFDKRLYKFPSYFRRSAIADAAGLVKSYQSNYENWIKEQDATKKEGRIFDKKPPLLQKTAKPARLSTKVICLSVYPILLPRLKFFTNMIGFGWLLLLKNRIWSGGVFQVGKNIIRFLKERNTFYLL